MNNMINKYCRGSISRGIPVVKYSILLAGYFLSLLLKILIISFTFYSCGGEFETLFDDSAHTPEFIYWTETSGKICRVNIDTLEKSIIFDSGTTPLDIDIYRDKIYWAEYTSNHYRIRRVSSDGTGDEIIYDTHYEFKFGPTTIAIDRSNAAIFFNQCDRTSPFANESSWFRYIRRSIISDTLTPVNWTWGMTVNYTYVYSIDVNRGNNKIYFTANRYYNNGIIPGSGSGDTGSVFTGNLSSAGTAVNSLASDLTGPLSPSSPVKGISVNGSKGHVYYVTNTSAGKRIRRADLSFNNDIVWIDEYVADIGKVALDYGRKKIYWTSNSDNKIYRADMDMPNSNVEPFVDLYGTPTGIALD